MKAAEKTIEFVKQWITGTYTKRQYQNYYIVRTPHAQFLMKSTEDRELMAIRDLTGHIYLFDDFEEALRTRRNVYSTSMSDPFLCLITDGFPFKYTCISASSIERVDSKENILKNMSKWKTLDRIEIINNSLSQPLYLSLISIGDSRFYLTPNIENEDRVNNISLVEWANHTLEQQHKFTSDWVSYSINSLYSNTINTVNAIKGNYVDIAGDQVAQSWYSSEGWVFIPTKFETIEELTGRPFRAAKKTRPNPYSYNLTGGIMNLNTIHRRYETIDEDPSLLRQCIQCVNIREDVTSLNWRDVLQNNFLPETAADITAFFEDDDAWLREHFEVARTGALEAKLKSKLSLNLGLSITYIHKEKNLTPLSEYVIYIKMFEKGQTNNRFMKMLPALSRANTIKGVFDGGN